MRHSAATTEEVCCAGHGPSRPARRHITPQYRDMEDRAAGTAGGQEVSPEKAIPFDEGESFKDLLIGRTRASDTLQGGPVRTGPLKAKQRVPS